MNKKNIPKSQLTDLQAQKTVPLGVSIRFIRGPLWSTVTPLIILEKHYYSPIIAFVRGAEWEGDGKAVYSLKCYTICFLDENESEIIGLGVQCRFILQYILPIEQPTRRRGKKTEKPCLN